MLLLSYGFKKPETNDKGNVFFPALSENAQKTNDHDHDGINSSLISAGALVKTTQAILAAAWLPTTGGRFRQEVTMPAGFLFAATAMSFIISGGAFDGDALIPTLAKGTLANQYFITTNDNTLDLTALYV